LKEQKGRKKTSARRDKSSAEKSDLGSQTLLQLDERAGKRRKSRVQKEKVEGKNSSRHPPTLSERGANSEGLGRIGQSSQHLREVGSILDNDERKVLVSPVTSPSTLEWRYPKTSAAFKTRAKKTQDAAGNGTSKPPENLEVIMGQGQSDNIQKNDWKKEEGKLRKETSQERITTLISGSIKGPTK